MYLRARMLRSAPASPGRTLVRSSDHVNVFFFSDPAATEIYTSLHTLSLHDALPISRADQAALMRVNGLGAGAGAGGIGSGSEEHTSELQSRNDISYAVFCLKKK